MPVKYKNMRLSVVVIAIIVAMIASSCNSSIKPEELYGEWKYIKVESPREDPPLLMEEKDLRLDHPSIKFSKGNNLVIMWGGRKLSHGTFRMENKMIRFKENLEGGATREFPFLITEFSKDRMVFETMSEHLTRVTAVRVK